jgi:hypothetical protein
MLKLIQDGVLTPFPVRLFGGGGGACAFFWSACGAGGDIHDSHRVTR